ISKSHTQSQQEIGSSLWIIIVFGNQVFAYISWYIIAECVSIWLIHFIENIVDQEIDFQILEIPRLSGIADSKIIGEESIQRSSIIGSVVQKLLSNILTHPIDRKTFNWLKFNHSRSHHI